MWVYKIVFWLNKSVSSFLLSHLMWGGAQDGAVEKFELVKERNKFQEILELTKVEIKSEVTNKSESTGVEKILSLLLIILK